MKKHNILLKYLFIITGLLIIFSCNRKDYLKDPEGNIYKTVTIGEQIWISENLRYNVSEECWCYNDDPAECLEMGRLYTWATAVKAAEEIPGWHLPSKEEWQQLINYCGDKSMAFYNIMSDSIGFYPQWAGVRLASGKYVAKGLGIVNYWSSTVSDEDTMLIWSVAVMDSLKIISTHDYPRVNACGVRLIKD